MPNNNKKQFICVCGMSYVNKQSLHKHKTKHQCYILSKEKISTLEKTIAELEKKVSEKDARITILETENNLFKQFTASISVRPNIKQNTIIRQPNTFNTFLEKCKPDVDFIIIKNMKIPEIKRDYHVCDLKRVFEKIIDDLCEQYNNKFTRPIHCYNKQNKNFKIYKEDKWEDFNKKHLDNMAYEIANLKIMPAWEKANKYDIKNKNNDMNWQDWNENCTWALSNEPKKYIKHKFAEEFHWNKK